MGKHRLDYGRVKCMTGEFSFISQRIQIRIGEELFVAHVMEEKLIDVDEDKDTVELGEESKKRKKAVTTVLEKGNGVFSMGSREDDIEPTRLTRPTQCAKEHGVSEFSNSNSNLNFCGHNHFSPPQESCLGPSLDSVLAPDSLDVGSSIFQLGQKQKESLQAMGCSGGANIELRVDSGVPISLGEDEVSRVEETVTPIVDDVIIPDEGGEGSFEKETESLSKAREDGEWVRKSRREKRCYRRKRASLGSLLGKHRSKLQRSRTHIGKKKKSQNRLAQGEVEEAGADGGSQSQSRLDSDVEGANKSVSEGTIRRLNERTKPQRDTPWRVGKAIGLNILGSEERVIERMEEEIQKDIQAYEKRRVEV